MTDTTTTTTQPGLAATARASLEATFATGNHRPSAPQWTAIQDLLDHLQATAEGRVETAVYLSAIPAGTGKSASLAAFAAALCASPDHAHVGMLILCNRVTEVADMATALGEHRGRLRVICGDDHSDVLALGDHTTADDAQVVVATQASLRASLRVQRDFGLLSRFHYQGTPRAVRCWDEAYAMRRPVIINPDDVLRLNRLLQKQSPSAVIALLKMSLAIAEMTQSGRCTVPDLEALGVDFHKLREDAGDDEGLLDQISALRDVSGQSAWAYHGNLGQSVLVKHIPELPPSLLPVVVTDASAARGVNHEAYSQMEESGMPLIRLLEATKTYANMTLKLVPATASRSVFQDKRSPRGRELIEMAVRYIQAVAPDPVLVISYRKTRFPLAGVTEATIAKAINARLTEAEQHRVRHLTWGQHTATNAHADVPRVLLLGLNFLPPASHYAESAALLDKPMHTESPGDHPTPDQVRAVARGKLRDSVLQAVLRGAARKGNDGDCGDCEVVIPQTTQTGLSLDDYRVMFPGVSLVADTELLPRKVLKGKLGTLFKAVAEVLEQGHREIANQALRATLGMSKAAFNRLLKHPDWKAAMVHLEVVPQMLGGGLKGMRLAAV
eukprot:gene5768-5832_t